MKALETWRDFLVGYAMDLEVGYALSGIPETEIEDLSPLLDAGFHPTDPDKDPINVRLVVRGSERPCDIIIDKTDTDNNISTVTKWLLGCRDDNTRNEDYIKLIGQTQKDAGIIHGNLEPMDIITPMFAVISEKKNELDEFFHEREKQKDKTILKPIKKDKI